MFDNVVKEAFKRIESVVYFYCGFSPKSLSKSRLLGISSFSSVKNKKVKVVQSLFVKDQVLI